MTYEKRGTKRSTKEPSDSTAELITEQFLSSLVTQHPVKSISQFAGTHSYTPTLNRDTMSARRLAQEHERKTWRG